MGILRFGSERTADVDESSSRLVALERATHLSDTQVDGSRGSRSVDGCYRPSAASQPALPPPPPPPSVAATLSSAVGLEDMSGTPDATEVAVPSTYRSSVGPSASCGHQEPTGRLSLGDLAGVRQSDATHGRHRLNRDRPRVAFRPIHAVGAVLLLCALLCASLTMLVSQAIRYERALSAAHASAGQTGGLVADDNGENTQGKTPDDGSGASRPDTESRTNDGSVSGGASVPDSAGTAGDAGTDDVPDDDAGRGTVDDGRIDLNTASSEELQTINGIGPVMADRIIAYRISIGGFVAVDQLLDVKGIGAKTFAKIRDEVTVR